MPVSNGRLSFANWCPTPNMGGALKDPTCLVVHYTAGKSLASSTQWLCNPASRASAHVIVSRDGRITNQLVSFANVAWACGESAWKGVTGVNRFSISLELDNGGPCHRTGDGKFRSIATGDIIDPANVVEGSMPGCSWNFWEAYPQKQVELATTVCREIVAAYPSIKEIVRHSDISPGRKFDCGPAFDVDALRTAVFGRA